MVTATENFFQIALQNKIRKLSSGRKTQLLTRRFAPITYPKALEANYAAFLKQQLSPLINQVETYLYENRAAILRGDSIFLDAVPGKSFRLFLSTATAWAGALLPEPGNPAAYAGSIYIGMGRFADQVKKSISKQFSKNVDSLIGFEFGAGEESWWKDAKKAWADKNYEYLRNRTFEYVNTVNTLVEQAVQNGWTYSKLGKELHQYGEGFLARGKRGVQLLARDQIGKLHGQIAMTQQTEVGIETYIWDTSDDERVRDSHRALEGKLCRWDDSSVYSDDGGKTWKKRPTSWTQSHPGQDVLCRCIALPNWEPVIQKAVNAVEVAA